MAELQEADQGPMLKLARVRRLEGDHRHPQAMLQRETAEIRPSWSALQMAVV